MLWNANIKERWEVLGLKVRKPSASCSSEATVWRLCGMYTRHQSHRNESISPLYVDGKHHQQRKLTRPHSSFDGLNCGVLVWRDKLERSIIFCCCCTLWVAGVTMFACLCVCGGRSAVAPLHFVPNNELASWARRGKWWIRPQIHWLPAMWG